MKKDGDFAFRLFLTSYNNETGWRRPKYRVEFFVYKNILYSAYA